VTSGPIPVDRTVRQQENPYRVFAMSRKDKALLDKQLWGVNPRPPNLIGLAFAAVFLGGVVIGSILFARDYRQAVITSNDVTGSIMLKKPRLKIPDLKIERPGTTR
jgi:hypothetical protein